MTETLSELAFDLETHAGRLRIACALTASRRPVAIVGPNGAGKTSLLRALLGLRPARGRIVLHGTTLLDSARRIDLVPELRQLGYVPQSLGLFPHLSAVANVAFGIRAPRDEAETRARVWLQRLEVTPLADRFPGSLSGGEQQRIALARALAASPRALLLDEPWSALDAPVRHRVRDAIIDRTGAEGLPTLVVTHDPDDVRRLDGQVVFLEGGEVRQAGLWRDVAAAPSSPFIESFFRGEPAGRRYNPPPP